MTDEVTWESLAKRPGGDRDCPYSWGHPGDQLAWHDRARLTILRGHVLDASHAETVVRYGGDRDDTWYVQVRPSGLVVPVVAWPDEA